MDSYQSVMVNSGKAFTYVPNMCGAASRIGTLEECISVACS
jgi:predicted aconitase